MTLARDLKSLRAKIVLLEDRMEDAEDEIAVMKKPKTKTLNRKRGTWTDK